MGMSNLGPPPPVVSESPVSSDVVVGPLVPPEPVPVPSPELDAPPASVVDAEPVGEP